MMSLKVNWLRNQCAGDTYNRTSLLAFCMIKSAVKSAAKLYPALPVEDYPFYSYTASRRDRDHNILDISNLPHYADARPP